MQHKNRRVEFTYIVDPWLRNTNVFSFISKILEGSTSLFRIFHCVAAALTEPYLLLTDL
jgi:hypothetical protein